MLGAQTITGRVVDSATHRPLAGLAVRLVAALDSARDTVVATMQTATDGVFAFAAPRPGTYRVWLGEAYLGPRLTLPDVDAEDQHEYVIGAGPPAGTAAQYHVLHGAELDSALRAETPLLACQVEKKAAFVPRTISMQFPTDLRGRGRTGSLLAEFVVDSAGHFEPSTLRISRTQETDEAFLAPVARGLAKARFHAAIADGRNVRQLMVVPVTFRLDTEAPPTMLQGSPCGPVSRDDAVTVVAGMIETMRPVRTW